MDRISRISRINQKYRGSGASPARVLPTGGLPIVPAPIGGISTIRRSRIGPTIAAGPIPYTGVIAGTSAIRGSRIVSPAVYQTVNVPPVYEVITTPPKVYQIRTPIIQVTPDTVIERSQVTTNRQVAGTDTRAWVKRGKQSSNCCPWWCWLLFGLLLLSLLAGGFLYFFKDKLFGGNQNQNLNTSTLTTSESTTTGNQVSQQQQIISAPYIPPTSTQQTQSNQNINSNSNTQTQTNTQTNNEVQAQQPKIPYCDDGSFLHNNKCLKCPNDSTWNGSQCIRQVITKQKFVEYKTQGQSSGDKSTSKQGQSNESSSSSSSSSSSNSSVY